MVCQRQFKGYYLEGAAPNTASFGNLVCGFYLFGSDAAILLWKLNDSKEPEQPPMFQEDEDAQLNKESWSVVKTLRYTTTLTIPSS